MARDFKTGDRGAGMELGDLRAFETVARFGRMNRAVAELNTVQSNINSSIERWSESSVPSCCAVAVGRVKASCGITMLKECPRCDACGLGILRRRARAGHGGGRDNVDPVPWRDRVHRVARIRLVNVLRRERDGRRVAV